MILADNIAISAQVSLEGLQRIRSMNDICRRSIEREMLSPEFLWASATGWIGDGGVG
jgi:hypothetical protein